MVAARWNLWSGRLAVGSEAIPLPYERYAPIRGTATVAGAARRVTRDIRSAWSDGRRQMRDTETELRKEQMKVYDRS